MPMRLQKHVVSLASFFGAGLMLLAFSGCDDLQARSAASDANSEVKKLAQRVNELEGTNAQLVTMIKSMQDTIGKQVADRMDRVEEKVLTVSKELQDKISKDAETTRIAAN